MCSHDRTSRVCHGCLLLGLGLLLEGIDLLLLGEACLGDRLRELRQDGIGFSLLRLVFQRPGLFVGLLGEIEASEALVGETLPCVALGPLRLQLGALLGVSAVQAEKMAAKLISDGRLLGHIDQVDQYMYFASETEPMDAWEKQVVDVSLKLNSVVERIV